MTLSLTFLQELFQTKCVVQLKLLRFSAIFVFFRNKARNVGCSRKNAGMREVSQNAGNCGTVDTYVIVRAETLSLSMLHTISC